MTHLHLAFGKGNYGVAKNDILGRIHNIFLFILGFMVVIIVSENNALFNAVKSDLLIPAIITAFAIIGIKIQMRIK